LIALGNGGGGSDGDGVWSWWSESDTYDLRSHERRCVTESCGGGVVWDGKGRV